MQLKCHFQNNESPHISPLDSNEKLKPHKWGSTKGHNCTKRIFNLVLRSLIIKTIHDRINSLQVIFEHRICIYQLR